MIKTYKVNVTITLFSLIILYCSYIFGFIKLINEIKNSSYPILMFTTFAVGTSILATKQFIGLLKTELVLYDEKIQVKRDNKILNEIFFINITHIDYNNIPIIKKMDFIYIYQKDNESILLDFGRKENLQIAKFIIEKVRADDKVKIDVKLLKRIQKLKE